jgi:hypothetical protein
VRLQAAGADLVDRRRSIELTATLLPPELRARTTSRALTSSVVWALERLRELVEADAAAAAVAQAREILATLETRCYGVDHVADSCERQLVNGSVVVDQEEADGRRIAQLEAQLKGWVAAVRMARSHSRGGGR